MASFANVVLALFSFASIQFYVAHLFNKRPDLSQQYWGFAPTIVGMMGASEGSGESPRRYLVLTKEDGKSGGMLGSQGSISKHVPAFAYSTKDDNLVLTMMKELQDAEDEVYGRLLQLPTWDEILPSVKVFDPEKWPVTGNRRNERVNDSTSYDLSPSDDVTVVLASNAVYKRYLDAATDFMRTMSPLNDDGEPSYVYKSLLAAAKEALGGDEQKAKGQLCYEGPARPVPNAPWTSQRRRLGASSRCAAIGHGKAVRYSRRRYAQGPARHGHCQEAHTHPDQSGSQKCKQLPVMAAEDLSFFKEKPLCRWPTVWTF